MQRSAILEKDTLQLTVEGLSCHRSGRPVFSDLGFAAQATQLVRLFGGNGVGKSTLLRALAGLLQPEAGSVRVSGGTTIYAGHLMALKVDLSLLENMVARAALAGQPLDPERARAALAHAGVLAIGGRPVRTLSQGQRQRGALAFLSLFLGSTVWLLDEPFNALDRSAHDWLDQLIAQHRQAGGIVVLASHLALALDNRPGVVAVAMAG